MRKPDITQQGQLRINTFAL